MHLDIQSHQSIAELLRAEREQLILAWEELEREQRKVAFAAAIPSCSPEHVPPAEIISTPAKSPLATTGQAPLPLMSGAQANSPSLAASTFRFLQREFDNKR